MSHVGQQFLAPQGWAGLAAGRRYHYLGTIGDDARVRLAWFSESPPQANLEVVSRSNFETGIVSKKLVVSPKQLRFPPWLQQYERGDVAMDSLEDSLPPSRKKNRKRTPRQEIDQRLARIQPLLDRMTEIVAADDMEQRIKAFARRASPSMNEARTLLWFCLVAAFGYDPWVLMPNRGVCGRKSIKEAGPGDFGRGSRTRGRHAKFQMTPEMQERVVAAWIRLKCGRENGGRLSFERVKSRILVEEFGCKTRKVGARREFYHPEGLAFPTLHQINYCLLTHVGRCEIQIALRGADYVRLKKRASKGSFSQRLANLLEKVEADAYCVKEVPIGPDGSLMAPLWVVVIRCCTSGMVVGIGFSIGAERSDAYLMALFSMALPKVQFCRLFGLEIQPEEWPCQGLPAWLKVDRGPGARKELIKAFEDRIRVIELAPAYSGQSKAIVESSHPRTRRTEGAPEYFASNLTYVELIKREILRLIAKNHCINRLDSMTPNMLKNRVFPIPVEEWKYLDERCRTCARHMPEAEAVTRCCTPVRFQVDGNGAYLHGTCYHSDALEATGICDRAEVGGVIELEGYVLPACVRGAWLKVGAQLVWVDMQIKFADGEEQFFMTLPELIALNEIRKDFQPQLHENNQAVAAWMEQRFAEETGKATDAGTARRGRANRKTKIAQHEYRAVKTALQA